MVYFDMDFIVLIWEMYHWKAILFFFWLGSSHQFCTILKALHFDNFQEKLWKVQNKNCAMGCVGVSRIALEGKRALYLHHPERRRCLDSDHLSASAYRQQGELADSHVVVL
jgi:hypothetical protein